MLWSILQKLKVWVFFLWLSSEKRKYLNILVRTLKNKLVYKGTYDKMS